jgi:uncharacterized protein with WD repeat
MKRTYGIENPSNASVCEWSPDGRHILSATLYKRLKVDNGIKIWHYSGSLLRQMDFKEMYQVAWKPDTPELWTDRTGTSPPPKSLALPSSSAGNPFLSLIRLVHALTSFFNIGSQTSRSISTSRIQTWRLRCLISKRIVQCYIYRIDA